MTHLFTRADVGCFVDSARGIYAGERAQEIAAAHGWTGTESLDPMADDYYDATDEATEYLNTLCHESVCFIWESGDLLLIEIPEITEITED